MTVFESLDDLRAGVGTRMGPTEWIDVAQARIDGFADATGDHQACYLTLSLTNLFLPQLMEVRCVSAGVNYGTGRVRFPAAVPAGARLRAAAELTACQEVRGGLQTTVTVTVEMDGSDKPACVVESLSRWLA